MSIELMGQGCERVSDDPMVIKNVKDYFHIHTYGGLTPFFVGLRQGKLMGTRCANRACPEKRIWLPPRPYCPDCLDKAEWVEAPTVGEIYTHTTVLYPGAAFKLSTPCPLISVSLEGVGTKLMSYLKEGEPRIGLPIKAVFRTEHPTNTILDLAWVPA
jgi:uncharacterized protein